MKIGSTSSKCKISGISTTKDTLSDRGGLLLLLRYLDNLGFLEKAEDRFGHLRKSSKGEAVSEMIRQFMAFSFDGSSHAICRFDEIKKDSGYAATLERDVEDLVSTAAMKRFFRKFSGTTYCGFRAMINDLFVWRLKIEQPKRIILHLDTMVLDNDDAKKREGVKPTYKNKCGFQPLQINWGPYIIDMHFRSGEKHSNHGDDAKDAVTRIVKLIRENYSKEIPIILCADSGFLSNDNLTYFEDTLKIYYVVMGKLYTSLYTTLEEKQVQECARIVGESQSWVCYDYQSKLDIWEKERRTILTSMISHEEQCVLEGIRDSVMYTNLGMDESLDTELIKTKQQEILSTIGIVKMAHHNGEEELNHRSIKDYMGCEQLPFKNFGMNGAYYSLMVIGHFFMEAFRYDVASSIMLQRCYPTSFRRIIIDIAAKIVRGSHRIVLKVTNYVWTNLQIENMWKLCNSQLAIS